jgi:hypothetical protein
MRPLNAEEAKALLAAASGHALERFLAVAIGCAALMRFPSASKGCHTLPITAVTLHRATHAHSSPPRITEADDCGY